MSTKSFIQKVALKTPSSRSSTTSSPNPTSHHPLQVQRVSRSSLSSPAPNPGSSLTPKAISRTSLPTVKRVDIFEKDEVVLNEEGPSMVDSSPLSFKRVNNENENPSPGLNALRKHEHKLHELERERNEVKEIDPKVSVTSTNISNQAKNQTKKREPPVMPSIVNASQNSVINEEIVKKPRLDKHDSIPKRSSSQLQSPSQTRDVDSYSQITAPISQTTNTVALAHVHDDKKNIIEIEPEQVFVETIHVEVSNQEKTSVEEEFQAQDAEEAGEHQVETEAPTEMNDVTTESSATLKQTPVDQEIPASSSSSPSTSLSRMNGKIVNLPEISLDRIEEYGQCLQADPPTTTEEFMLYLEQGIAILRALQNKRIQDLEKLLQEEKDDIAVNRDSVEDAIHDLTTMMSSADEKTSELLRQAEQKEENICSAIRPMQKLESLLEHI